MPLMMARPSRNSVSSYGELVGEPQEVGVEVHVAGVFEACGQLLEDDGAPLGWRDLHRVAAAEHCRLRALLAGEPAALALFAGRAVAAFAEFGDVQMRSVPSQTST